MGIKAKSNNGNELVTAKARRELDRCVGNLVRSLDQIKLSCHNKRIVEDALRAILKATKEM